MEWPSFVILLLIQIALASIPNVGWMLAIIPEISARVLGLHVIRLRETKGHKMYTAKTYLSGYYFFVPFLALQLCWFGIILLGLLCLILPGLFLMFCGLFSIPLMIEYYDEHITFSELISVSIKVTEKKFLQMAGFQLLNFLFVISGILLFGVGLLVTIPMGTLVTLVAFKDIFGLNPHKQPEQICFYLCGKLE